jgi:MATE family multidrug resistance protein
MIGSSSSSSVDEKPSDFRQLVNLFFPLVLTLCATNLIGFFDRLFLANGSVELLEGYVIGFVLAMPFQMSLMKLTTFGQVFVSSYNNERERHFIGEAVWQMIWVSLLSTFVVLPVGYAIMPSVCKGGPVQDVATEYFTWMLWGNFLFPLRAALSSFFIGQNRTKIVLAVSAAAQVLHILLDYLLIFGVENYIPPLGVLGAGVALIANQLVVCGVLFFLFLNKNQRKVCRTDNCRFNWNVFCRQLRTACPVALAPFIANSAWTAVGSIMATKGGDYLLVFSVGSTLTLCFSFVAEALFQSVMTSASNMLKKKDFSAIKKLTVHAIFLLCLVMLFLSIPFFVYPEAFLSFLIPTLQISSATNLLLFTCYFSWVQLLCRGILLIGMGLLASTQQTLFFIFSGAFQWITGYLVVFITIGLWNWEAHTFWLIISASLLILSSLFFLKMRAVTQSLQARAS